MPYDITTDRLGLRNWTIADLDPFADLCADPEVMAYFPNLLSRKQATAALDRYRAAYQQHGYTFYAVEELDSKTFLGFVGLYYQTMSGVDWTPALEIGWRLRRASWGHGYATEAAQACLQYAWKTLEAEAVVAITTVTNQPSIRVMHRLGMDYAGTFDHPALEEDDPLRRHVLYRVACPALR